jgi:Flp pilus assembly pilin Flp
MVTDIALRMVIALQRLGARTQSDDGQTLAEYSLIISAIAVGAITISVITFRETLVGAFNSASACLADPNAC